MQNLIACVHIDWQVHLNAGTGAHVENIRNFKALKINYPW